MICCNYHLLKRLGARAMTIFVFEIFKLKNSRHASHHNLRDLSGKMRRKISRRSVALAPSETAWGPSYDLFCVFNVHLCGASLACLAGAFFFTIFNVYLCGHSIACLAGAKLFTMFNAHLCGPSLACLSVQKGRGEGFSGSLPHLRASFINIK